MKITKRQLKSIIREVIEESTNLGSEGLPQGAIDELDDLVAEKLNDELYQLLTDKEDFTESEVIDSVVDELINYDMEVGEILDTYGISDDIIDEDRLYTILKDLAESGYEWDLENVKQDLQEAEDWEETKRSLMPGRI